MLRHRQMTPFWWQNVRHCRRRQKRTSFHLRIACFFFLLLIYCVDATNDTQIERNTTRRFVFVCRGEKIKKEKASHITREPTTLNTKQSNLAAIVTLAAPPHSVGLEFEVLSVKVDHLHIFLVAKHMLCCYLRGRRGGRGDPREVPQCGAIDEGRVCERRVDRKAPAIKAAVVVLLWWRLPMHRRGGRRRRD